MLFVHLWKTHHIYVLSIKITLYRVARNSSVIKYLLEALDNGKEVTVNGHCGADYGSVKIDVNNNIVEVNATMFLAYFKIENGTFIQLDKVENVGDGVEKARTELEEKYSRSNFVDISTELTSQNIDTYVK